MWVRVGGWGGGGGAPGSASPPTLHRPRSVDPALFSRALMAGAAAAVAADAAAGRAPCVRAALAAAHAATAGILGSATAVIATSQPNGTLAVAVLGDSGFRLLRGGRVAAASDAQQHAFNTPFQLAAPGAGGGDEPGAADVYEVEAAAGDVLVLAR